MYYTNRENSKHPPRLVVPALQAAADFFPPEKTIFRFRSAVETQDVDGTAVEEVDGTGVGIRVGIRVGTGMDTGVGTAVATGVGTAVGTAVGTGVACSVASLNKQTKPVINL